METISDINSQQMFGVSAVSIFIWWWWWWGISGWLWARTVLDNLSDCHLVQCHLPSHCPRDIAVFISSTSSSSIVIVTVFLDMIICRHTPILSLIFKHLRFWLITVMFEGNRPLSFLRTVFCYGFILSDLSRLRQEILWVLSLAQPGSCCSWPLRLQRNSLPPSFNIQVPLPAPARSALLDQMCPAQCTGVSNDRLELEITMVLIIKHHDF